MSLAFLHHYSMVAGGYAFDPDAPPSPGSVLDLRYALAPASANLPAKADGSGANARADSSDSCWLLPVPRKRLALSAPFLSLLLYSLVFCLDTASAAQAAKLAIAAVQQRATIEMIPQVLVATTALQNVALPTPHAATA